MSTPPTAHDPHPDNPATTPTTSAPPPSSSNLLAPNNANDEARLSAASSLFNDYYWSAGARASTASILPPSTSSDDLTATYGASSAVRRNSSPTPTPHAATARDDSTDSAVAPGRRGSAASSDASGSGLHRRSSSRLRESRERTASGGAEHGTVDAGQAGRAQRGWGVPVSPTALTGLGFGTLVDEPPSMVSPTEETFRSAEGRRPTSGSIRPLPREPGRSSSMASTSSSVRPLPTTPTRSGTMGTETGSIRPLPTTPDNPLQDGGRASERVQEARRGVLFGPSTSRPALIDPFAVSSTLEGGEPLARHHSDPFSLSPSSYPSRRNPDRHSRDSEDEAESLDFGAIAEAEGDEEITSRSPLQPSYGTPPQRSKSFHTPRGARLASLAPPLGSLSPSNLSPSDLVRRKSITTAGNMVDVVRRMSVRVVNMQSADTEETLDAEALSHSRTRSISRSPSRSPKVGMSGLDDREHPHQKLEDQDDGLLHAPGGTVPLTPLQIDTDPNPLLGYTLGVFGPHHPFRRTCASVLRWWGTEPIILMLIILSVIVFTIQSSPNVYTHPRPAKGYFHEWEDYALFVLFVAFTVEIFARIVVTGLVINPIDPTAAPATPLRSPWDHPSPTGPIDTLALKVKTRFAPPPSPSATERYPPLPSLYQGSQSPSQEKASYFSRPAHRHATSSTTNLVTPDRRAQNASTATTATTATSKSYAATPFALSIQKQRTTYQQAFLRHSWNRLDAVAVVAFWISFLLSMFGWESGHNLWMFRALSVLRATRLLAITEGTTTIIQSMKKAAPQLVSVAFFVIFAMALFSIIGIQSFKGSYRRTCQWIDPTGTLESVNLDQLCGGFVNSTTGEKSSYIVSATGLPSSEGAKGFICPSPSICIEDENPDSGAWSFDNIFASLMQVVIVASANTWTSVMYNMMDADFFESCIFFIVGLVVLNYWLINMFVAVITNTFGGIMDDTKHSAFAQTTVGTNVQAAKEAIGIKARAFNHSRNFVRKAYQKTRYIWVLAVLADVVFQATRTYDMSVFKTETLDRIELIFTLAFDLEILVRAFGSLPEWRIMYQDPENAVDLFLAITTSIIQIPPIHNSKAYPWLTCLQIARFYRVILAIPRTKRLLVRVLGTFNGLVNMILFMIMMTFIAALISAELVRGIPDLSNDDTGTLTFYQIYDSFLAMYQILSSENWTDVLTTVISSEVGQVQLVVAAAFLCGWMLFAYFILINMFIAVLQENFAIAEEVKHKLQLEEFVKRNEPPVEKLNWFQRLNPYLYKPSPHAKGVSMDEIRAYVERPVDKQSGPSSWRAPALIARARDVLGMDAVNDHVPLTDLASPTEATGGLGQSDLRRRPSAAADYFRGQATSDRSLWVFSQKNFIRRFCQSFVEPSSNGAREHGRKPTPILKLSFQLFVFASIIGSVAIAAIATPNFRRAYMLQHGNIRFTWFNVTEAGLGLAFVLEFLVKIIADGFLLAPHAYLQSMWNVLDFTVLLTLIVNLVITLADPNGVNRFVRALKALRALRLINLSPTIRETFYNVLIVGAGRILDASILAILYIIPFAIWGQNVFSGLLFYCNDSSVTTKADCAGEFLNSAVSDWNVLTPRVWQNPYVWSFDSFKSALLILFEIISLEGWIDVMESVMQIKGKDLQPEANAQQWNALFFVTYNLVGAVFILTLFVSVIIESFTRRSGMSLLTTEQRQWIDLRKLITLQRPAKRPKKIPQTRFRRWCFDRAVQKHGWWSRSMTFVYIIQIGVLMSQAWTNPAETETIRNYVFLGLTLIFFADVAVRAIGLGWRSFFQAGWSYFDVLVVLGTIATTVLVLAGTSNQVAIQFQKLFLVCIALKLVQKNNSLNQLFKTATASLPALTNIFALWIVLFLVWAIAYIEVFGLTRWGQNGTRNANYSSFWKAIVLLVLASTGEGWNSFMHDYTVSYPDCTTSSNYLFSDCGSAGWAYALFISWNVLSMYLMSNLILGAVVENFSYVFQVYDGKVKTINREQMRSFKKVWAQFDPERTGFLQKKDIVKFFGRLTGVFEVKIYRSEWSLPRLYALAIDGEKGSPDRQVNISNLNLLLGTIDYNEVQRRKHRYNRLFHEAMLEAEGPKGIAFTSMLLLLAHHCLITDEKALRLEEMLARREKTGDALARVNADGVRGMLKMLVLRRQHLLDLQAERQLRSGAPAIVLDAPDDSPRNSGLGVRTDMDEPSTPASPTTPTSRSSGLSPSASYESFGRAT